MSSFLKAACHVHSEWSYDAKWPLSKIHDEFGRRGYRVVLMTEHDKGFSNSRWAEYQAACASASSDRVLIVPGIEYSDPENIVHVLVWGDLPFLGEALQTEEMLQQVSKFGGTAVLAHPTRRDAWKRFRPEWTGHLHGIELWNRKTDGWAPSKTAPALISRTGLSPFAGLDFHARNQLFPLSMQLFGGGYSRDSVYRAVQAGKACLSGFPLDSTGTSPCIKLLALAEPVRRFAASAWRSLARR
jgi:predicted metal-dependent phosphoesterase TrpH